MFVCLQQFARDLVASTARARRRTCVSASGASVAGGAIKVSADLRTPSSRVSRASHSLQQRLFSFQSSTDRTSSSSDREVSATQQVCYHFLASFLQRDFVLVHLFASNYFFKNKTEHVAAVHVHEVLVRSQRRFLQCFLKHLYMLCCC